MAETKESEGWDDLMGNGGVFKRIVKEGDGPTPEYKQFVRLHLIGKELLKNKVFQDTYQSKEPLHFPIGDLILGIVDNGVMLAVKSMKLGEVAELRVNTRFAFGPEGLKNKKGEYIVHPETDVEYKVELVEIGEMEKMGAEMTHTDFVDYIERYKGRGNEHYFTKAYDKAEKCYKHAVGLCEVYPRDPEQKTDRIVLDTIEDLHVKCLSNLANVYEKQERLKDVIDQCTKALGIDEFHLKTLVRVIRVSRMQGNFKEAKLALNKAEARYPGNKIVQGERFKFNDAVINYKEKRKDAFSGVLDKKGEKTIAETKPPNQPAASSFDSNEPFKFSGVNYDFDPYRLTWSQTFYRLLVLFFPTILCLINVMGFSR